MPQHGPPQQLAECEVALALPTSAIAARIISRYFISSSCWEFLFPRPPEATEPIALTDGGARWRNRRTIETRRLCGRITNQLFAAFA